MINLEPEQIDALKRLRSGSILCGGVGSGKSLTAIAWYYFTVNDICSSYGRRCEDLERDDLFLKLPDLYVITTAKKRDSKEWESDFMKWYGCKIDEFGFNLKIDSWNNIKKYADVKNAIFIFDEQRLVGYGTWVKKFLKIARSNRWILLTATPGDTWMEYMPIMIANGYFKNKSDFICRHVVYNRFTNFPLIDRYVNVARLEQIRNDILVNMDYESKAKVFEIRVRCNYDKTLYDRVAKNRWNPFENWPVENVSQYCALLHRISNSDPSRIKAVDREFKHLPLKKVIIFYNYTYELDILRDWCEREQIPYSEWNGQKHEPIQNTEEWVYLVQYNAGSEGWNCIETNVIFFYSQSYSYKAMTQAKGRVDRRNTSFDTMRYFIFESDSSIDKSINRSLRSKKSFNEKKFYEGAFNKAA